MYSLRVPGSILKQGEKADIQKPKTISRPFAFALSRQLKYW